MLHNIKPNRSKSETGSLTKREEKLVKGLLKLGYAAQDIVHIVNQGRNGTINPARITEIKNNNNVNPSDENEVTSYIEEQSSYDHITLLNAYKEKDQRVIRAREAMIAAVQVFNNPSMIFKTELFCVLANIAWTYLIHEKMERTKPGSSKLGNGNSVSVDGTLDKEISPIKDKAVIENLKKVIEIRNEVEHTFFVGGEKSFGPLFQACCINFDRYLTEWFGQRLSLAKELSLSLQFVKLQKDQIIELEASNFPKNIKAISKSIKESEFADNNTFQLNVYYTTEATSKTSADIHKLISDGVIGTVEVIKKVSKDKLTSSQVVRRVVQEGYKKFTKIDHQNFWKTKWKDAAERNKKADKQYGELFNGWGWYEDKWLPEVLEYCRKNEGKFK